MADEREEIREFMNSLVQHFSSQRKLGEAMGIDDSGIHRVLKEGQAVKAEELLKLLRRDAVVLSAFIALVATGRDDLAISPPFDLPKDLRTALAGLTVNERAIVQTLANNLIHLRRHRRPQLPKKPRATSNER